MSLGKVTPSIELQPGVLKCGCDHFYRQEIKTASRRKRANSGGGGSKVGNVGQTMIREKIVPALLIRNLPGLFILPCLLQYL